MTTTIPPDNIRVAHAAATIGVEPTTPTVRAWLARIAPTVRLGDHAVVRRRNGTIVTVYVAVGTVARLDRIARDAAPTWGATYTEVSG